MVFFKNKLVTRTNVKNKEEVFLSFFFYRRKHFKMQASLNYCVQSPCFCFCMSNEPNSRMENIEFGIMRLNNVENKWDAAVLVSRYSPYHQPITFLHQKTACVQGQGRRDIFEALHLSKAQPLARGALCVSSTVSLFILFCMSNDFPPRVVSTWQQVSKRANFPRKSCIQRSSI